MIDILKKIRLNVKSLVKLKESKYFISLAFFVSVIVVLDCIIYIHEIPAENSINSIEDIIWWNIVTLTTVGYGDMYPTTFIGKLATILLMLCGIATFAYLLSAIVEYVLDINQRKELGLMRIKMEDHIIICNWNERANDLFNQLSTFNDVKDEIVLVDNSLEKRPNHTVTFVKGSPSDINTLHKANILKAKRIIILAKGTDKSDADANTVLTSLAIRSISPDVILCAEILDPNNSLFLKNAKVDHIIDINALISRFIAQTTHNPKLLTVLNELVSNESESCEIYRCKIPASLQSLTYIEILQTIKETYDCLVIALEQSREKNVILNPKMNEQYNADFCFVIAKQQPIFNLN